LRDYFVAQRNISSFRIDKRFSIGDDIKLEEQMQISIKLQGKSKGTFATYWHWCKEILVWLKDRNGDWVHPSQVGEVEVTQWLTLASIRNALIF
jgi:hypothetical protein